MGVMSMLVSCDQYKHHMQPKPVSFRNILPQRIVLFAADTLQRYPVFMDRDIGIPKQFRQLTKTNEVDEDCESTEDVVEIGLKECLRLLEEEGDEGLTQQDYDSMPTVRRPLSQDQQEQEERSVPQSGK